MLIFFSVFNFHPEIWYFCYQYQKYQTNTEKIPEIFGKTKLFVFFADNVVHLGIFGISGPIPKSSVLLNFSIGIFLVFNSIEISVLKIFGIQYSS